MSGVKVEFEKIIDEALAAASAAQEGMIENPNALDCGFAWVVLGGNEPIARFCRAALNRNPNERRRYGSKGYPTGWQWWCPGDFNGQSIGIHEAGARAFRDTLALYGIRADMCSRLD